MPNRLLTPCVIACATFALCNLQGQSTPQPTLGHRTAPLITVDGLQFKDLDRNGILDPYEDWRLSPEVRAADLVQRMSIAELAGLMVHGTLPTSGALGAIGVGDGYDLAKIRAMVADKHANTFITRLSAEPSKLAAASNAVQEIAESSKWGIPAIISSDPRHHFVGVLGAGSSEGGFSHWPDPLGLAATNDEALVRSFGDAVRREYSAVGIRESLAPQADLATDPRWARANGTFGEDPDLAKRMVFAYVAGIQSGSKGLNHDSVIAVVKHWVGYGAEKDGWDGHNFYGRFTTFPGDNFKQHIIPFTGAFDANVAAVMPTYVIPQDVTLDGKPLAQVGAGFSRQLITDLLRGSYHFKGVILSDWGITNDCGQRCREGAPADSTAGPQDIGMPWGVEGLTPVERFAMSINAGVDQIGGTEQSDIIVDAVQKSLIPEARVREAAQSILIQKFQLGIFEQPYVDEAQAAAIVGSPEFVHKGEQAQTESVVLLQNTRPTGSTDPLLPVATGKKVYLFGIAPTTAQSAGFTVVTDPAQADLAIIKAPAPWHSEHTGYFFGSRQHEGRLEFTIDDPAYAALLRVSAIVPTVFITNLERPVILKNVVPHTTALLGEFGIMDAQLLALITGKSSPAGHLPFELPSSIEAVREQKSDVPHDSKDPLFTFGFGLQYKK